MPAPEALSFHRLLLGCALIASVIFAMRYGEMMHNGADHAVFAQDFEVFYLAAKASADSSQTPYGNEQNRAFFSDLTVNHYHPFLNPPIFLLLLWPLHFFGHDTALAVFLLAQLAFAGFVFRLPSVRALWPQINGTACLCLSLPFAVNTVLTGQTGIFYASLLLLGFAQLKNHPKRGGALLALVACKPSLALMVPVLLLGGKHWRALAACVLTVAALSLLATSFWGFSIWSDWLEALRIHSGMMRLAHLPVPFQRQLISIYANLHMLGVPQTVALAVQAIVSLASAGIVFIVARRYPLSPKTLALVCVSTLLASAYVLEYDAPILVPALLVLLGGVYEKPPSISLRLILLLAVFSPLVVIQLQMMLIPLGSMVLLLIGWQCLQGFQAVAPKLNN